MTMNVGLENLNRFVAADEESRRRRLTSVEILDYRPTDDQEVRLAAAGRRSRCSSDGGVTNVCVGSARSPTADKTTVR
ncbi:hypothetical protein AAHH76_29170 [Bacillus toyonensis]